MIDKETRKLKDVVLIPFAKMIGNTIHPVVITIIGFLIGLAAVASIYLGLFVLGLVLWVLNRIFDGLDGVCARYAHKQTDIGGYLDIVVDFFIYTGIPLAFAFHFNSAPHYLITMLLLGSFYINAAVWMSASSLYEKYKFKLKDQQTTFIMPRNIMEGFETIVFFTLFLIFPAHYIFIAAIMTSFMVLSILTGFIGTLIQVTKLSRIK